MIKQVVLALAGGCLTIAFAAHAGDANAGKAKSENCAMCHGETGKDDPPIAGMDTAKFIQAMKEYQSGVRNHKKMAKATKDLSEADIADLAAFYAALK
jgi:cytochrome c553